MTTLEFPTRYAPVGPTPSPGAGARVGHAFATLWHHPSYAGREELRRAIALLAERLRASRATPEASVLVFKRAVFRFGGMRELPSLALDHHADGDECAAAYADAFRMFVDAYFGAAAP